MTKVLLLIIFVFLSEPCIAGTLRGQKSNQRKEEDATKRLSSFFFDSVFHSLSSSNPRKEKRRQMSSIPSKCLEDPDDPDCEYDKLDVRDLQNYAYYYYDENEDNYYSRPKDTERVMYVQYQATSSPTQDMCYGNMEKFHHGKFCLSEMPSVSQEPSDQPTRFPTGPDGDDWTTKEVSDSPSDVPSSIPTILPLPTTGTGIPTTLPSSIQPTISTSSTKAPTITPSSRPAVVVTASPVVADDDYDADDDDDDTHYDDPDSSNHPTKRPTTRQPTRQPSPLPTYQEDDCPASFSSSTIITAAKSDTVRFTLAVDHPGKPQSPQAFRLRLYWEEGYYWQEEDFERTWCLRCQDNFNCNRGENLYLGYCGPWTKSSYFDFLPALDNNKVLISMIRHDDDPLWNAKTTML